MGSVFYLLLFLNWDTKVASNKSYFLIIEFRRYLPGVTDHLLEEAAREVIHSRHGDRDGRTFNKRPVTSSL